VPDAQQRIALRLRSPTRSKASEEVRMRRILVFGLLCLFAAASIADTRKGFEAYQQGDFKTAIEQFRSGAAQGDALAQFYLGECYFNGRGVPQNFAEGVRWYTKSAEQGQIEAQETLGGIYFFGKGAAQDYALAAKWYRGPAESGKAYPQFLLGYLYDLGKGVAQNHSEAAKWYAKAAEQDNHDAQEALALLYFYGRGVTQDYAQAAKWYRKVAERGKAYAQYLLGWMYENGPASRPIRHRRRSGIARPQSRATHAPRQASVSSSIRDGASRRTRRKR
jgi:TPR repeat protein